MKKFTFSILLMILALSLFSCSAPAVPASATATFTSAPPTPTKIPTPEPTATAAPTEVSFQESENFNPADHLTWSGELQTLYGSLKDRTAGGDQAVYAAQDIVMHERINSGLTNFLYGKGVDVRNGSEKEIVTAFGNWQKDNFTKTGEMVLMPADIAMMKSEMMNGGDGTTTDEVPLFGEKVKRALIAGYENMTIAAIMENPTDPNSAIINVTLEDGSMRPFLVNFEEKTVNNDQIVYYIPGDPSAPNKEQSIYTVAGVNAFQNKVDLSQHHFVLRATDGSNIMFHTTGLVLLDLFNVIGEQVSGYQIIMIGAEDFSGSNRSSCVVFNSLFDYDGKKGSGLEILEGITYADRHLKP